jgi:hypothetical protein
MLLDFLKPLTALRGPFVTVTLDVTASTVSGTHALLRDRWQSQRRSLIEAGVGEALLERFDERLAEGPRRVGEATRVLCATPRQVALDIVVPGRTAGDEWSFSPVPHLMSLLRLLAQAQPYALARVGRNGSDITVVGLTGPDRQQPSEGTPEVIHKVPGGGWWRRGFPVESDQAWSHHTRAVAEDLDSIVTTRAPEVLLLEGEDEVVSDVIAHLSGEAVERTIRLDVGRRVTPSRSSAQRRVVAEALRHRQESVRAGVLAEFSARLASDGTPPGAVEGLGNVVSALQQRTVEHLLIDLDPTWAVELWVGGAPAAVGTTPDQAAWSGDDDAPQPDRADDVLMWSLADTGGQVTLLEPGDRRPKDGVGAILV